MQHRHTRGYLMLTAIVYGAIFLSVLGALSSYVLSENKLQSASTSKSRGLAMAEAGLEYYRWHLAHFTSDLQNGTGSAGPYSIPFNDPEGGQTGTITLSILGNQSCGEITSVDITSTGTPVEDARGKRTVMARYAKPTVARFSYILNDSVWAGDDRTILGPYHSNGGIRMDGTVNSPVTSSLSTWLCTSSFGCSPSRTKAGVWGDGNNQNLWSYPKPQVDFDAISANFSSLKTKATTYGKFFATNGSATSNGPGYHLIFNTDGTLTVKKVSAVYTNLDSVPVYDSSAGSESDYTRIKNESLLGTYTLPSDCGLIYVEDNIWVEGTITKKITLVAADAAHSGVVPDVVLLDDIVYQSYDGTDGLTLIAEGNVLISPLSPFDMTLNGIFIAQTGAFGRNLYDCPGSYEPKGTLTILGTTVSNKRTGTKWVNGCGWSGDAGYQTRTDAYDRRLATDPPPFTPFTSTDYTFVDWREK
ncbi:MAG: hypothetical protein KA104_00420 [Candidatus Pacebacteria bacterium]|nr:hypothetical protein [Candidatus Paceibacterota bacterium]